MAFDLDTALTVPESFAQVGAEVDATTPSSSRGARPVARALQSLYALKQGAMVWEYYGPTGAPLNVTTDRVRHWRAKTQMFSGLPVNINNAAADVYLHVFREFTSPGSTWELTLTNVTTGLTLVAAVNGGAQTIVGGVTWNMGQIAIDDTVDFNEFNLECTQGINTVNDRVFTLSIIPRRSFPGNVLPDLAGGLNRSVNQIEMVNINPSKPATSSMLLDLNALAIDLFQRRVGQVVSSSYFFSWVGTPGDFTAAHRFIAQVPAGVDVVQFWFLNGPNANVFRVEIVSDNNIVANSKPTVGGAWEDLTVGLSAPRWGGAREFIVSAQDDFVACCAWWQDAIYAPEGI